MMERKSFIPSAILIVILLLSLIPSMTGAFTTIPTDYTSGATGKLAAYITGTQTTNIKITADTYRTPAGTGPVSWPTGNQFLKLSREVGNRKVVEYITADSATQSSATVTLANVTRNLSHTGGSLFGSQGDGLSHPVNTVVELIRSVQHEENTVYRTNNNSMTGSGKLTGSASTLDQAAFNVVAFSQAQINAFTTNSKFDIAGNDTTGTLDYYDGSSWLQIATSTGSVPNAGFTTRGVIELATPAEIGTKTASGSTNAALVAPVKDFIHTSSGSTEANRVVTTNSSGVLESSVGGTGSGGSSMGTKGLLYSNGTQPVKAVYGSASGDFIRFNSSLNPIATPSVGKYVTSLCAITAATGNKGNSSVSEVNVARCTIPANSLKAGDVLQIQASGNCRETAGSGYARLKLGNADLTGDTSMNLATNDVVCIFTAYTTIRTIGASGTAQTSFFGTDSLATIMSAPLSDTSSGSIVTTSAQNLDFNVQFTSSSANNYINLYTFVVTKHPAP